MAMRILFVGSKEAMDLKAQLMHIFTFVDSTKNLHNLAIVVIDVIQPKSGPFLITTYLKFFPSLISRCERIVLASL